MYIHVTSNIGIGLIGFAFSLGSDFESAGKLGTSHFLEHLMCKSFDHLLPRMKQLGIDYNAYTDSNRIVFWFSGLYESLNEIGKIVYSSVTDGKFKATEESFDIEKSVVLQEYGDTFNNQIRGTIQNSIRKHYNYFSPIGLKSDIENFTYDNYLESISKFSKPYLLCEVGDNYINSSDNMFIKRAKPTCNPIFDNYDVGLEEIPKENKTIIGLINKNPVADEAIANRLNLIDSCINDGLESPLFTEIREKRGLSYASHGWMQCIYNSYFNMYCAITDNDKATDLKNVYSEFFNGDLSRHITQKRFNECYQSTMIKKKMLGLLPHDWAAHIILGDDPFKGLDNFTYDEAIELFIKHMSYNNFQEFEFNIDRMN